MTNILSFMRFPKNKCSIKKLRTRYCGLLLVSMLSGAWLFGQDIPTPASVFGHEVGATYHLIDYEQSVEYFKQLAAASDRMELMQVGHTSMERPWYISVISTPENLQHLDQYRANNMRIAHPEGLSEARLKALIKEQPIFVDINGGLHAAEVAGSQHTNQFAYELLSMDEETFRAYFDKTILILWPTLNPDGQDIVTHWYREIKGTDHPTAPLKEVYQKYIGHDNNRDGYMLNMQESRVLAHTWRDWEPEILHVHHQMGHSPERTDFHRIWIPPFSAPVGVHTPARILREMNTLGMQMAQELETRGLHGATHAGDGFDAYYTGYNDYINMYHNTIAYWTEVDGGMGQWAEPYEVPREKVLEKIGSFRSQYLLVSPWKGGQWNLSDQVEYMIGVNYGVLKYAKHNRQDILYNRYAAGMETITHYPELSAKAYLISQAQQDPNNAVALLQRMAFNGIKISQLDRQMDIEGKTYPAGTWVIPTNQEFGNLVPELLSVMTYPKIMRGEELKLPYDVAGWTLPYSMGVHVEEAHQPLSQEVVQALTPVRGEPTPWDANKKAALTANPVAAGIQAPEIPLEGKGTALAIDPTVNHSYILINRALKAGGKVTYKEAGFNSRSKGQYIISGVKKSTLEQWAEALHIPGRWTGAVSGTQIKAPRVGLYMPWHGNFYDVGWNEWLLETYGFQVTVLHNADIQKGNLSKDFDVLLFSSIGSNNYSDPNADSFILHGYSSEEMPAPYAGGIEQEGVRALRTFTEEGGKLVFLNASSDFAIKHLKLPVKDVVKGKARSEFFGSGSLFRASINQEDPLMSGVAEETDIFFNNSPVFETTSGFEGSVLVRYPKSGEILRSGYLTGEENLRGQAAALRVKQGKGEVVLFGFSPQWRGQTFGTFKMLFNALLL